MKMKSKILKSIFSIVILVFTLTAIGHAQYKGEQNKVHTQLKQDLKNDYFSLSLLVQGMADFQPDRIAGYNGFSASKGRFKISGIFDNRFGYNLQATMLKSPSVLDANVYYKASSNVSLKAGLFKAPFTHEYHTGAASVLFVDRSVVVNQLGPKRQVGVQVDGFSPNGTFRFTGGIFNGNNYGNNSNDDDHFQYIGRVEAFLDNEGDNTTKVGVNVSYEQKDTPASSGNIQSMFEGDQTLLGSYFSTSQGKFLLDGEFIYSWLNPDVGQEVNPYGYYVTAGYNVAPNSRFLLRWDSFTGDNLTMDSDSIVAGFNYKPSKFAKLKLNYILPTDQSVEYSNFLAAIQLGF